MPYVDKESNKLLSKVIYRESKSSLIESATILEQFRSSVNAFLKKIWLSVNFRAPT